MKITWLGQMGFLLETEGFTLMTDPYLLDTLHETAGERCRRLVPVQERFCDIRPDAVLISHDHTDHLDLPSLKRILSPERPAAVLSGANAWNKLRQELGGGHNFVRMLPGVEWSFPKVRVTAIPAIHSDPTAIGFRIEAEGKTVCMTGDTLYSAEVAAQAAGADVLLLPVNGEGNNMNAADAARFAAAARAKLAVPGHWGLLAFTKADPVDFAREAAQYGVPTRVLQVYETMEV